MDIIKQYQNIEQSIYKSIDLLDNIWVFGNDIKFNSIINQLTDDIRTLLYQNPNLDMKDYYDKLITYKTLFRIDIEKDRLNGAIASMMHSHVIDNWRLLLLQINTTMIRLINAYLWCKKNDNGKYIQQLQNTFTHKNRTIKTQRAIIKMLSNLVKSNEKQKNDNEKQQIDNDNADNEYEIIKPTSTHNIFSYWFSNS